MDYKSQSAKAMAEKQVKSMSNKEIESLASKEKKKLLIFCIIISICAICLFACGIISFIVTDAFLLGIFSMILAITSMIYLIWQIIADRKKSNKDLVVNRLERKYINKPDLIDNEIIFDNSNNEKTNKEQLQELKEIFEEGLITQEEYEAKKKQILGL